MYFHRRRIDTIIIPPSIVKKFICDKGNAGKDVVVEAYNKQYKTDFNIKDNNEVDALILARIGFYYCSGRTQGLYDYQTNILEALKEKCVVSQFRSRT